MGEAQDLIGKTIRVRAMRNFVDYSVEPMIRRHRGFVWDAKVTEEFARYLDPRTMPDGTAVAVVAHPDTPLGYPSGNWAPPLADEIEIPRKPPMTPEKAEAGPPPMTGKKSGKKGD